MGTLTKLLESLGFVRLRDFGLILTPDRRVLTTRPAVLDDGYGGCVVGWNDGDLATMELGTWGAPKPAPPPKPLAVPKRPPAHASVAPEQITVAQPAAPAPPEDEDEWEWEIAVARAHASVPEVPAPAATPWLTREPLATDDADDTEIRPMHLKAVEQPRPNTIIPVPSLPVVDPRLVRTYEAPRRFPRSTNQRIIAAPHTDESPTVALPAPTRQVAHR